MSQYIETEIPKHIKQKESSVSKAKKKTKHKHQYEECLIQYRFKRSENIRTTLSSYCIICGKRGNYLKNGKYHMELEQLQKERQNGKPYWIPISGKEIYERYHGKIPVFFINDVFSSYIPIGTNNIK